MFMLWFSAQRNVSINLRSLFKQIGAENQFEDKKTIIQCYQLEEAKMACLISNACMNEVSPIYKINSI